MRSFVLVVERRARPDPMNGDIHQHSRCGAELIVCPAQGYVNPLPKLIGLGGFDANDDCPWIWRHVDQHVGNWKFYSQVIHWLDWNCGFPRVQKSCGACTAGYPQHLMLKRGSVDLPWALEHSHNRGCDGQARTWGTGSSYYLKLLDSDQYVRI